MNITKNSNNVEEYSSESNDSEQSESSDVPTKSKICPQNDSSMDSNNKPLNKALPLQTQVSTVVNIDEKITNSTSTGTKIKEKSPVNDSNKLIQQAKVYFSPKDDKFLLICGFCDGRYDEVPQFIEHTCESNNPIKAKKNPEESIGTETNLVIGKDGLWHCRICDKGYEKKNSLKKHEQAHLLTYNCEICGKGLKSPVNLREHMNIHSGARPYKCHICPMAFARKWGLTSHVRSHIGDKRYSCEHCGKKFVNGAILKIHVRMVHTKEKPCQCELCGRHFYSNQLLNEHKKRHMNIRPYKCEHENCGKSFYDKKQLTRHYVSHSDEKPFECSFGSCAARFARHKTLQAHLKIHTGVKDHICPICGKGFAMNYNLTSHLKSHANGKIKGNKDPTVKRQYRKKNKEIPEEPPTYEIKIKEESQSLFYDDHHSRSFQEPKCSKVHLSLSTQQNVLIIEEKTSVDNHQTDSLQELQDDKRLVMMQDTPSVISVPSTVSTPVPSDNLILPRHEEISSQGLLSGQPMSSMQTIPIQNTLNLPSQIPQLPFYHNILYPISHLQN